MSWICDSSELISGGWLSSEYAGHGVRGDQVSSSGTNGPSPVFNDLSLPADNAKEYRWTITSPPSVGVLVIYEDCSYTYTPPGGTVNLVVTYQYRLWQDGVDLGVATETITIGSVGLTIVADPATLTIGSVNASVLIDRLFIADSTSLVLTPNATSFLVDKLISANSSSLVLSAVDSSFTVGSAVYIYPAAQYVRANLSYGPTGSENIGTWVFDVLIDVVTGHVVSNTNKTIAIPAGSTVVLSPSDVKRGISFGTGQTGISDGFLSIDTKSARLIKPLADKMCVVV